MLNNEILFDGHVRAARASLLVSEKYKQFFVKKIK
jgi:hypothetical protein